MSSAGCARHLLRNTLQQASGSEGLMMDVLEHAPLLRQDGATP